MAAIDKTYIKTAAQYKEVYDWVMSLPEQTDDLGLKFKLSDWLPREYDEHLNDIGPASPEYMEKQIEEHKKPIDDTFKNENYWNENKQWYTDCETYQDWLDYVDKFFGEICLREESISKQLTAWYNSAAKNEKKTIADIN